MTVADYTDTPFARLPRLHHKDALEGPSSAPFGRRNLVGLMGVMMGGGASPAPWTPTENAYVQTDGVGWIDTGWSPTSDGAYSTDIRSLSGTEGIIGCLNTNASARLGIQSNSRAMYSGIGSSTVAMTNGPEMRIRAVRGVDSLNQTIQNGADIRSIGTSTMANMRTFTIGGRNYTTVDNKGKWIVWSFEAWTNGVKVLSLWPREMDGVAGLWDTVNNAFITATGGSLTYGISAT